MEVKMSRKNLKEVKVTSTRKCRLNCVLLFASRAVAMR
jgi:hypothetical protein